MLKLKNVTIWLNEDNLTNENGSAGDAFIRAYVNGSVTIVGCFFYNDYVTPPNLGPRGIQGRTDGTIKTVDTIRNTIRVNLSFGSQGINKLEVITKKEFNKEFDKVIKFKTNG